MVDIGPLNKTSPFAQFWLNATIIAQSQAGNYSTIRITATAYNTGNTSSTFLSSGQHWGAIDGIGQIVNHSANPFLPSVASGALRWQKSGDYNYYHDANGNAGTLTIRMGIAYGSIDESHVAYLALPRIPKVPAAPTPLSLDMIGPTSMRYRFSGNDNGGSGITGWQIQYGTRDDFGGAALVAGTGTDTLINLTPGADYFVRSRGLNAVGAGAWSAALQAKTLSGARVGKGGAFVAAEVRVGVAGAYVPVVGVRVGKGGSYVPAG